MVVERPLALPGLDHLEVVRPHGVEQHVEADVAVFEPARRARAPSSIPAIFGSGATSTWLMTYTDFGVASAVPDATVSVLYGLVSHALTRMFSIVSSSCLRCGAFASNAAAVFHVSTMAGNVPDDRPARTLRGGCSRRRDASRRDTLSTSRWRWREPPASPRGTTRNRRSCRPAPARRQTSPTDEQHKHALHVVAQSPVPSHFEQRAARFCGSSGVRPTRLSRYTWWQCRHMSASRSVMSLTFSWLRVCDAAYTAFDVSVQLCGELDPLRVVDRHGLAVLAAAAGRQHQRRGFAERDRRVVDDFPAGVDAGAPVDP